ncbi:MAG: class I SAM-dependent methyltransferase [Gaiellaceae bacterium]
MATATLALLEEAFATTAAVTAADRLGVFERIDGAGVDTATLARDCGISERGAALLLGALVRLGLAQEDRGRYQAALVDLSFVRGRVSSWERLAPALQQGGEAAGNTPGGAESLYAELADGLGRFFTRAAESAACRLARPGLRILDAGSGAAPWSIAIAAREPDCTVTALDLPAILPAARRAAAAAGVQDRFRFVAGDLFTFEIKPRWYDLVIAANVCHLFDEGANCGLVGRLADAVRPRGTLAIVDVLLDSTRPVALYALGLMTRTRTGRVYPLEAYESWAYEAGLGPIEQLPLPGSFPLRLLVARRGTR